MKIGRKSGDPGSWLAGRGTCILFDTKRGETPDCWKREGCSCCQWKRRRLSSQRLGRQHNQEAPYCDLAIKIICYLFVFLSVSFFVCSSTCLAFFLLFPGHRRWASNCTRNLRRSWALSPIASCQFCRSRQENGAPAPLTCVNGWMVISRTFAWWIQMELKLHPWSCARSSLMQLLQKVRSFLLEPQKGFRLNRMVTLSAWQVRINGWKVWHVSHVSTQFRCVFSIPVADSW